MSRLQMPGRDKAVSTVEGLYMDMVRRMAANPQGVCPVDVQKAFLQMCHAQSCGKCVPCRIGLGQLAQLLEDVLEGSATVETLELIENTAQNIAYTADCAIGYEAANMVLKGLKGFREEYLEHIEHGRCASVFSQPVPCVAGCPAGVDVPGYLALVREGSYADAIRLIRKDNPFPTACAMICEHPCESKCRRTIIDAPVNIRGLKRFAADNAGEVPVPACAEATGKHVAVIGGGPGGLTAAYYLALMGHKVTVYEQFTKLGGMMRYGIPSYRLPRERLQEDIDAILSTGVEVKLGMKVGKDISFDELRANHDAVYISIGAHTDKKLGIEGEDAKGVMSAVEMLRGIGDEIMPDFAGKTVAVVGGGNVAMDVARTAVRLGAEKVTIAYRRRQLDMTALPEEIEGAIAEGVEILPLMAPARVETDENGQVKGLVVQPQMIGKMDAQGRPRPVRANRPEVMIQADIIVVAIGQGIESEHFKDAGMELKWDSICAGKDGGVRTLPGVFAGGDCVTGPATVIKAIGAGKVAAANIDAYLGYNHEISCDVEIPEARTEDHPACGRVNTTEVPACDRKCTFAEAEIGMSHEEACQESGRCLRCDHYGFGALKGGRTARW